MNPLKETFKKISAVFKNTSGTPKSNVPPQIDTIYDRMWNDQKSHGFIVHLIQTFSPLSEKSFAATNKDLKLDSCCICKKALCSKDQALKRGLTHEGLFVDYLGGSFRKDADLKDAFKDITNGRLLGIVSKDSKMAFCQECYSSFITWVQKAVLSGNIEINNLIKTIMSQGSL
jgi:hypothetical protein